VDVRQRIVDVFLKTLADSPSIEHPLQEELARLVRGTSVTEKELLDLFQAVVDREN